MPNRLYDNSDKVNPLRDNPLKQLQRNAGRIDKMKQDELDTQAKARKEFGKVHD